MMRKEVEWCRRRKEKMLDVIRSDIVKKFVTDVIFATVAKVAKEEKKEAKIAAKQRLKQEREAEEKRTQEKQEAEKAKKEKSQKLVAANRADRRGRPISSSALLTTKVAASLTATPPCSPPEEKLPEAETSASCLWSSCLLSSLFGLVQSLMGFQIEPLSSL